MHRKSTREEGVRIVKVAAFCFALISWLATAQGLYQYVFRDRYWQALLISFGIQSILFVFNLKLPEYFVLTVKRSKGNDTELAEGGADCASKSNKRKKGFVGKAIICILYVLVMGASSFFSFVYITNYVYADTRYNDANIILDRKYRTYLDNTYRYLNEYSKLSQITISEKLSELKDLVPASKNDRTETELKLAKNEAYRMYQDAVTHAQTAELTCQALEQIMNTPDNVRWRDREEHEQEKLAYELGITEWETAQKEKNAAYLEYQNALSEINTYKPSADISVHEILEEILKPTMVSFDMSSIEGNLSALIDYVIATDNADVISDNFADIVNKIQIAMIAVNNYMHIIETLSETDSQTSIEFLQENLLDEVVVVPQQIIRVNGVTNQELIVQKQEWETVWRNRLQTLERIVRNVPRLSESEIKDYHGVIDVNLLISYDPQAIADDIDYVSRTNLEYINVVERAFALLSSEYSFLAWFSLGLAVFLDLASMLAGLFIYLTTVTPVKERNG